MLWRSCDPIHDTKERFKLNVSIVFWMLL
jgi:hypothetical protein